MLKTLSPGKGRSLKTAALLIILGLLLSCAKSEDDLAKSGPAGRDYAGLFYSAQRSLTAREGGTVTLSLKVKNAGRAVWSSTGKNPSLVSFHLLDRQKKLVRWDNTRFPLPRPVKPGETCPLTVLVKAPLEAGRYFLEFDLLREGLLWFKDQGSSTFVAGLKVEAREWPDDRHSLDLKEGSYTRVRSSRGVLEELVKLIRLTLDEDEVVFKGRTGKVKGFAAGASYPQIWLRDASTIIPASQYFFGGEHLRSWLNEHLAFQNSSGSLEDWIDSAGLSGKNTSASDQETSAVQAAAQVCRIEGTDWLRDKVGNKRIIDRLETALQFLLTDRYDERTGLVKRGHTLDWGDVDIEDADEKATGVDERTHWVAGIYDQGMFYQAARDLAWMFGRLGQKEKSFFWTVKAESLKDKTDKWLWMKDKGFYRVHVHLDPLYRHAFEEDDIFALGGNVAAVLSGLADETKRKLILEQALVRQKSYGLSTAGGSLLPPYPRGTYQHPLADDPYEYQNGGQWDWFGGRLILALFQNGFSRRATDKLLEVVAKDLRNGGFFEWDDKAGAGRGSDFYAGSAGSLARALFEGYFGISLAADSLSLEPRLGLDAARVHVYQPLSGLFVAYDYRPGPDGRELTFDFNSNFPGQGVVRIRLPWPVRTKDSLQPTSADYELVLDGRPAPFTQTRVNEDEYLSLETDFRNHRLEIRRSVPGQAKPGRYLRPTE